MAASHVQRNTLVAPFSVNSPLLEKGDAKKAPVIAITHQKWFTEAQQAINGSAQITGVIPANSNAPGQPGTFAFDSNWLYICVGHNIWRRAALNVF
jgi:hypothetical protein